MGYNAWLGEYDSQPQHQCEDGCILVRKDGGNVCMNQREDELHNDVCITINFTDRYIELFGAKLRDTFQGMLAEDSIPILHKAIDKLSDDGLGDNDGWGITDGNVKRPLKHMLGLAKAYPNEKWTVSR